jgi:hypothetical protein
VYPEWHPPEPERVAGCLDLPEHWREGYPLPVSITVAEPGVRSVALELRTTTEERWQPLMADLDRSDPYTFTAILPPESLPAGSYLFRALVASTDRTVVLPGNLVDSDDHGLRPFAVFRADTEPEPSAIQQSGVLGGKPSAVTAEFVRDQVEGVGDAWVRLSAPGFEPGRSAAGFRFAVGSAPEPGQTVDWVRVRARGGPETRAVEVGFVLTDGRAYGTVVPLAVTGTDWQVPVEGLIPLWGTEGGRPDFSQVREVSFVFGAWLFPDVAGDNHWVDMGDVVLGSNGGTCGTRPWRDGSARDRPGGRRRTHGSRTRLRHPGGAYQCRFLWATPGQCLLSDAGSLARARMDRSGIVYRRRADSAFGASGHGLCGTGTA